MHIESKNDDFLMYTLNAGKPVPSLYTQYYRTDTGMLVVGLVSSGASYSFALIICAKMT